MDSALMAAWIIHARGSNVGVNDHHQKTNPPTTPKGAGGADMKELKERGVRGDLIAVRIGQNLRMPSHEPCQTGAHLLTHHSVCKTIL